MEKNKSSTHHIISYLFIFLLVIVALTYYRIFIRHDYFVVSPEEGETSEMSDN